MGGRTTGIEVALERGVVTALEQYAASVDHTRASVASAVLAGAMASGQVDRLVAIGETILEQRGYRMQADNRKGIGRASWHRYGGVSTGTMPTGAASMWTRGEWILHYEGDPRGAIARRAGEGWHLHGPGIERPRFVGWRRRDAMRTAAGIIARHENGEEE